MTPLPIKQFIRGRLDSRAGARYIAEREKRSFVRPKDVVVSFGGVLPREEDVVIQGGRVKLLSLRKSITESDDSFSILYLVSSALPPFARRWAAWAQRQGVAVVLNQNGVAYPGWAGAAYEEINREMKGVHAIADHVVYQSRFCQESAERFLGRRSGSSEVAFNPVDRELFSPGESSDLSAGVRLLSAGTIQSADRAEAALGVAAELTMRNVSFSLTFAGRFDWPGGAADVERMVAERGLRERVHFVPPYLRSEAPAINRAHHILLHTKYNDPSPGVVIEALACGLPVVGSASGGLPELVGEAGALKPVPASYEKVYQPDAAALADGVIQVMERWPRYHAAARAMATGFDEAEWVRRHKNLFTRLVAERRAD